MQIAWPQKIRELQTAVLDSTRWNGFKYRENDVVVDTWAKSGTTWVMQIAAQLLWDTPNQARQCGGRSKLTPATHLCLELRLPAALRSNDGR